MKLTLLGADAPQWFDFVRSHPDAHPFHHPAWADLLTRCYGFPGFVVALVDDSQSVLAGFPVLEVHRPLGGRRLVALPFTDHCAPLILPEPPESTLEAALAQHLASAQSDGSLPPMEIRWPLAQAPRLWSQPTAVLHLQPLAPDPDQVFARFSKMHQRNVRKAERAGICITLDRSVEGLRHFYRLHLITRQRQGVPVQPWRFFADFPDHLFKANLGFVLQAWLGEQCVAAAVFLTWNGTLVYKYGASDLAHAAHRPNHLLFWNAIQWGCAHGCTTLDWGRTDEENQGLREFKSGWGAEERPLLYTTIANAEPKPASDRLDRAMAAVIRRAPPQVCRALGELLYRYAA
jgi:CelD/BcsL family acetyltransferase involved in cellulose biosynthesis